MSAHPQTCFCSDCRGDVWPVIVDGENVLASGRGRNMAKEKMPSSDGAVGRMPKPEGGNGFNPFLKAEHIKAKGVTTIQALGVRKAQSQFSDFVLEVKIGTKTFDWGLKTSSTNYRELLDRFGDNPKKWRGAVKVQRGNYAGRDFVKIA